MSCLSITLLLQPARFSTSTLHPQLSLFPPLSAPWIDSFFPSLPFLSESQHGSSTEASTGRYWLDIYRSHDRMDLSHDYSHELPLVPPASPTAPDEKASLGLRCDDYASPVLDALHDWLRGWTGSAMCC